MPAVRRLTALVTMLVTLLLVLTESGFACSGESMAGMDMAATVGGASMADMPGMPAAPPADAPAGDDGAPDEGPCRFPWAPAGCRDMAPCAPATLAVTAWVPRAPAPALAILATLAVLPPASVDAAPEPPPPRA